jgi:ATP-binding cassette subfamily F protein uup
LEAKLADPGLYGRDPTAFQALSRELDQVRADLASAEEAWLALEERREALETGR